MAQQEAKVKPEQIVENEMRVRVLEKLLERIMQKNSMQFNGISQSDIDSIQDQVVEELNKKYPGANLEWNRN